MLAELDAAGRNLKRYGWTHFSIDDGWQKAAGAWQAGPGEIPQRHGGARGRNSQTRHDRRHLDRALYGEHLHGTGQGTPRVAGKARLPGAIPAGRRRADSRRYRAGRLPIFVRNTYHELTAGWGYDALVETDFVYHFARRAHLRRAKHHLRAGARHGHARHPRRRGQRHLHHGRRPLLDYRLPRRRHARGRGLRADMAHHGGRLVLGLRGHAHQRRAPLLLRARGLRARPGLRFLRPRRNAQTLEGRKLPAPDPRAAARLDDRRGAHRRRGQNRRRLLPADAGRVRCLAAPAARAAHGPRGPWTSSNAKKRGYGSCP